MTHIILGRYEGGRGGDMWREGVKEGKGLIYNKKKPQQIILSAGARLFPDR